MIKLIIFLLAAVSITCGSTGSIASNPAPFGSQLAGESKPIDTKQPSDVVRDFMNLISSGEDERANNLMSKAERPAKSNGTQVETGSLVEVPPRLDWVQVFAERKYRLRKVSAEEVKGDQAQVHVELGVGDRKDFKQNAVFQLQKENKAWVISAIDLVFDPPRSQPKKSS